MLQNFTTQPALNNSHWDFSSSPSNEFAIMVRDRHREGSKIDTGQYF